MKKTTKLFVILLIFGVLFYSIDAFAASKKKKKPSKNAKRPPAAVVAKAPIPRNGTIVTLAKSRSVFLNQDCQETNTCDLKTVSAIIEHYKIWIDDSWTYGTSLIAEYETKSIEDLEKYAFVNFIRGCVFESQKNDDGAILKSFGFSKEQFGRYTRFCFPGWVIDSVDTDPVFNSDPDLGRHYLYRWNSVSGSYDWKTEKFYGKARPERPILYVKDIPGGAFLSGNYAINTSLELKTCLYRAKDIPLTAAEDNINFAAPLYCVDWQSSFIYNHDLGIFETKAELDPFCLKKPPPY